MNASMHTETETFRGCNASRSLRAILSLRFWKPTATLLSAALLLGACQSQPESASPYEAMRQATQSHASFEESYSRQACYDGAKLEVDCRLPSDLAP